MKLEKIDENTIKCVISSSELMDRNIQLSDLAYGGDTTRELFSELLEQASEDFDFEVQGAPFMIEAVPLRDGGIELLLTRVDDPSEIDLRYSKLTRLDESVLSPVEKQFARKLCGAGNEPETQKVFIFDSLDDVIGIAGKLFGLFEGESMLYKNPQNKKYYLLLDCAGRDPVIFASTCNMLSEYAKAMPQALATKSFLEEHYEIIIKKDALDALSQI